MVRYDKSLLDKFCHENEVILETSYDKLNRETIIKGKCKTNGCLNNFSKPFRNLLVSKNFCNQCSLINSRTKCENTNLIKYGCVCPLLNDTIKQKGIETCLINYGVENPSQSEVIKNKIKKTNLEKYGVECSLLNKDIMNKTKETNLKKYGSVHHMLNETIKDKFKDTCLDKYGATHPMLNEIIKNKIKNTNMKTYGFENPFQNETVKTKIKETNIIKYGNTHHIFNEIIKNKIKETCLKKYGVENPLKNEKIKNKIKETNLKKYSSYYQNQNCFKENNYSKTNKAYKFPSGKTVTIQGYENIALDKLLNTYEENEIINKRSEVPRIEYEYNKKLHYYFPDIFIPKDNLIIEVKSNYTYKNNLLKNILKSHAVRKLNYNYEIWIFDNKKNLTII
jgi:hypothetical protein